MHSDTSHSPGTRGSSASRVLLLLASRSSGAFTSTHCHGADNHNAGSGRGKGENIAANSDFAACCERLACDNNASDGWLVDYGCG